MTGAPVHVLPVHVLIVDDIKTTRTLLASAISTALEGMGAHAPVITEASCVAEAMALADRPCDLALVDLRLPDGAGWDIIRRLKQRPGITVAAVTVMDDNESVEAALAAGADGYLLKDAEPELLVFRLSRLIAGEPSLSPSIARMVLARFRVSETALDDPLTPREREVLSLVARGLRANEAATHLKISPHTVRDHLKSIYRKLDVSSRAEMAIEAQKRHLT